MRVNYNAVACSSRRTHDTAIMAKLKSFSRFPVNKAIIKLHLTVPRKRAEVWVGIQKQKQKNKYKIQQKKKTKEKKRSLLDI